MFKIVCILFLAIKVNFSNAQILTGNFKLLAKHEIKLVGFIGLKTYPISNTTIDEKGNFSLRYSKLDYGVGYLTSSDEKPLLVILCGEDIEIIGEALSYPETIKINKGEENKCFVKYAKEQPRREKALSAWQYLEKIYILDSLFYIHTQSVKNVQSEKERIKAEETLFLNNLPEGSYVSWFLPIRKLLSSVSTIAQYRPEEITSTISALRKIDYTDSRLYKSCLFKESIESHFWLLENSSKSLDSVNIEMQRSIDIILLNLQKDERILNESVKYLFELLETHSLFEASEYLALKVLHQNSCNINDDLEKQLESYRIMKKGKIAPEINFGNSVYLNGVKQSNFKNLACITTPYTLVVFGASWCPKCTEEFSKLIQNYTKWHDLGLEVVHISLDDDQEIFEENIHFYPFFTYCDYMKWESQVVKEYYVLGTPTFYLLNNKREIILKPNSIEQVSAWIDWVLVKKNK